MNAISIKHHPSSVMKLERTRSTSATKDELKGSRRSPDTSADEDIAHAWLFDGVLTDILEPSMNGGKLFA
jgi:hypothetical protein